MKKASVTIYPQGVAENFKVTYTEMRELTSLDSSNSKKVQPKLKSPLNEDYENLNFKYQVFPKGVAVDFYDKEGRKNTVVADKGIKYTETNIIDLIGNVVITSHDGKILETPQLYWDQSNKWIFTEEEFTYTNPRKMVLLWEWGGYGF